MITTATWVPRGFAAPFPSKYQFDEEEFERIAELAKLQLEDAKEDLADAQKEEKEEGEQAEQAEHEGSNVLHENKAAKEASAEGEDDEDMGQKYVKYCSRSYP